MKLVSGGATGAAALHLAEDHARWTLLMLHRGVWDGRLLLPAAGSRVAETVRAAPGLRPAVVAEHRADALSERYRGESLRDRRRQQHHLDRSRARSGRGHALVRSSFSGRVHPVGDEHALSQAPGASRPTHVEGGTSLDDCRIAGACRLPELNVRSILVAVIEAAGCDEDRGYLKRCGIGDIPIVRIARGSL